MTLQMAICCIRKDLDECWWLCSVSRQLLMTIRTRDHISVLESLLDFILVPIDSLTTMYFNDNT